MAKEKLTFQVRQYYDEENRQCKGIFIDGKLFDWGVDEDSYKNAMEMGPKFKQAIEADIAKHFLDSLSEFMNRPVTAIEINEAQKTGLIDK